MQSADSSYFVKYSELGVEPDLNMFNILRNRRGVLGGYAFRWQGTDPSGGTVYMGRKREAYPVLLTFYPAGVLRVNAKTEDIAGSVLDEILRDVLSEIGE